MPDNKSKRLAGPQPCCCRAKVGSKAHTGEVQYIDPQQVNGAEQLLETTEKKR